MRGDATIILTTPRAYFGDQRQGAFRISLDRRGVGLLMPQGSLDLSCPPGRHRLRARNWWFASPRVELELAPGAVVHFSVDLARRDSLLKRFLTLMFLPRRAIAVTAEEASPAPEPMPGTTTPRGAMWLGTGGLIGAMVALFGLEHGLTAVAVLGAVVGVFFWCLLLSAAWKWRRGQRSGA
jgi:hypothetical protein